MLPAFIVALIVTAVAAAARYVRARGRVRVVHCPAVPVVAVVALDPLARRIRRCSLWPERRGCTEACRREIALFPDGCRLDRILSDWYRSRACVTCGRRVAHRGSALQSPDGHVLRWNEIPPAAVFTLLDTHQPVCTSCVD